MKKSTPPTASESSEKYQTPNEIATIWGTWLINALKESPYERRTSIVPDIVLLRKFFTVAASYPWQALPGWSLEQHEALITNDLIRLRDVDYVGQEFTRFLANIAIDVGKDLISLPLLTAEIESTYINEEGWPTSTLQMDQTLIVFSFYRNVKPSKPRFFIIERGPMHAPLP